MLSFVADNIKISNSHMHNIRTTHKCDFHVASSDLS